MGPMTPKEYWDTTFTARKENTSLEIGWRNRTNLQIARKFDEIGLSGKSMLEIGAGDSSWLPYLAGKYPECRVAGLDYSEVGCVRVARKLSDRGLSERVHVYNENMFASESALHGIFDVVFSYGVVEHFTDLPAALVAKRRYASDNGLLFTVIPNMAGVIGHLTKKYNRHIYDIHNPHDWESFSAGHRDAGLHVLDGGYLGSTNFGVLSSCFEKQDGFPWHTYVFLTRLSKGIWLIETMFGDLPTSRTFSPYIYAISRPLR